MIDIKDLQLNKDKYIKSFANKGSNLEDEINEVIELHIKYMGLLKTEEEFRVELNKISNEIKNNPSLVSELKEKAKSISDDVKATKEQKELLLVDIKKISSFFPNITSDDVPVGKDATENTVLETFLDDKKANEYAKPHWDIIEEKNLILTEESNYISGSRQVIYNDKAAQIIKAIEQLMLNTHTNNGYTQIEPPVIVNEVALFNTGQLPKFGNDLYKLDGLDQYLIPTAEVPLTNLVANKIIDKETLPINFVASTQCFRKEAGSAGKDTRGLIRLHQFRKVELVKIGNPSEETHDFNALLKDSSNILELLELPYRTVELCTGDIGFSSKKTIDLEVWMPGVQLYREISSVSCMGQFQARRMQARFVDGDIKTLVNTYNASGLAIGRTFAAIVENYIKENGMIEVPKALTKYVDFTEF